MHPLSNKGMIEQTIIGWREWAVLPRLGIPALKVKVDTGARTSALHVFQLDTYIEAGQPRVRFAIHPLRKNKDIVIECDAEVIDQRLVRDSGGHSEQRVVILTPIRLGTREWPIEITLTNREDMLFRMLLGRTALAGQLIVDPALSYVYGRKLRRSYRSYRKQQTR